MNESLCTGVVRESYLGEVEFEVGFEKRKDRQGRIFIIEVERIPGSRSAVAEASTVLAHLGNSGKWELPAVESSH